MALWGLAIGVWCRQLSFEDQSSEWGTSAMRATKTRWMLENFLVRRNSSPSSHPAPAWLEPGVSSLVWGRLRGLSHSGFPSWQGDGRSRATSAATLLRFLLPFSVFRQKVPVCFATYSPIAEVLRSSSLGMRENLGSGSEMGFPHLSMSPKKKTKRVGTRDSERARRQTCNYLGTYHLLYDIEFTSLGSRRLQATALYSGRGQKGPGRPSHSWQDGAPGELCTDHTLQHP